MKSLKLYALSAALAASMMFAALAIVRVAERSDGSDLGAVDYVLVDKGVMGTGFVAEGYWYTAKHVVPGADSVGVDVVRLGAADQPGYRISLEHPKLLDPITIVLAEWPGVPRVLHGFVVYEEEGDGYIAFIVDGVIFPGCSGSPILNAQGEVIGVLSKINPRNPKGGLGGVFTSKKPAPASQPTEVK